MRSFSISLLGMVLLAWLVLASFPSSALSESKLEEATLSPDITISVDAGSLVVEDEDAVIDFSGPAVYALLGTLPANVALTGYHLLPGGLQLFSLDTTVLIARSLTVEPRDVVLYEAALYSRAFDGSAAGVPAGAGIDAITFTDHGELVLSFDVTVDLSGVIADDEDLVSFDEPNGTFSIFFDGSAAAVPSGLDLDGAHYIPGDDHLLLSFDGSGSIDGVEFDDEDVLQYYLATGLWEKSVDTEATEVGWTGADLDAFHAIPSCEDEGGDVDGDQLCGNFDNCPTVKNGPPEDNQTDRDSDNVGDACDNCVSDQNPPASYPGYRTTTGGQLDDDADGYGNQCDGKFTPGPIVTALDTIQYKTAVNRPVTATSCGTAGALPCDQFDLDAASPVITALDTIRFKQLLNLPVGAKCDPCGVDFFALPCVGTLARNPAPSRVSGAHLQESLVV
jgi:hypothetical protein